MKTKIFTKARGLMMLILATMISTNVWAAAGDVITLIDFTQTGNLGHSVYTDTWTIAANTNSSGNVQCAVGYAVSNNEEKLRAGGGKSSNLNNQDCYIGTKSATSVPVSAFSVNVVTVTNDANITINSVKLYVYSNSSWSTQVDCVERTSSYATGTVTFTPTSGTVWASGAYFKLVWNISTSATGSNHFTAIDKLQITEGSTKSLSSIALKTSATKTAYVAGEDFAAAGMVITATYSDASTEDIDYDSNSGDFSFSPSTNLSAGTTSVTVTYGGQTCTQTIAVYSVSISMVGEDESTTLTGAGIPSAPTRSGASINADNTTLYGFKKWVISNASLGSAATTKGNTITNPTGAVTLKAVYNAPRTVTWLVDGNAWTPYTTKGSGEDGTAAVQHGKAWSTLTLPTDPTPSDGCGQKFIGWVASPISGSLDKDDDAAAISALDIMTSANKASKTGGGHNINSNITFYAVFADYGE